MKRVFILLTFLFFVSSAFAEDYIKKSESPFNFTPIYDLRYLLLSQSTPQTITGGAPIFGGGLKAGLDPTKSLLYIDASALDQTNNYSGFTINPSSGSGVSYFDIIAAPWAVDYRWYVGSAGGNVQLLDISSASGLQIYGITDSGSRYVQHDIRVADDYYHVGPQDASILGMSVDGFAEFDLFKNTYAGTQNTNEPFRQYGYITSARYYIQNLLDSDGYFKITRSNVAILGMQIDMPLDLLTNSLLTTGTLGAGAITGTSFIIGANTLTTAEWAFLDGQDQSVFTTSSPTFANIKLSNGHIYPSADSTTALAFVKADNSTYVMTVDTTNGRVGVGITPQTKLHLSLEGTTVATGLFSATLDNFLFTGNAANNNLRMITASAVAVTDRPQIVLTRVRGTVTSPTATLSGDSLGAIFFQGMTSDGNRRSVTNIVGEAEGTVTSTIMPGRLTFSTTNAAGTLTEAVRIDSNQWVGIGITPLNLLHVQKGSLDTSASSQILQYVKATNSGTGGATILGALKFDVIVAHSAGSQFKAYGISGNIENWTTGTGTIATMAGVQGALTTAATSTRGTVTQAYGMNSIVGTGGATVTFTKAVGYNSEGITVAANGTITSAYNFYGAAHTKVGTLTNAYGLYLETQTVGATLNWQIYSAGGNSAFGGNTRFGGVTAPTVAVDVTGAILASTTIEATTGFKCGGTAAVADATYPVYNDGITSGQVTGFTTKGGIITAITVVP